MGFKFWNYQCIATLTGFVRGITKSYKVLHLFLENKTSYKVLYFIEGLIFFDRSYIFLTSLIFMSYFGCALSVCQTLFI